MGTDPTLGQSANLPSTRNGLRLRAELLSQTVPAQTPASRFIGWREQLYLLSVFFRLGGSVKFLGEGQQLLIDGVFIWVTRGLAEQGLVIVAGFLRAVQCGEFLAQGEAEANPLLGRGSALERLHVGMNC